MTRIAALLYKEFADLKSNPGIFFPAVLTGLMSMVIPFGVAIVIPALTGEQLSSSSDFQLAAEMYRDDPRTRALDPEGAIQAWIFLQFLALLVLSPIAGAMSIAAYSVIGEKQARTLEPLLATPITTRELLVAKALGALIPACLLSVLWFVIYVAGVAVFARPGVFLALIRPQPLAIVLLLGPLASLAALLMAVCVSSRVNDARGAQQIGALIILPVAGVLIAQLTGNLRLTGGVILSIALFLAILNVVLLAIGVRLFDRESILTRWK